MRNRFSNRNIFIILFILWCCVILTLTSIPKLQSPTGRIIGFDKIAHFGIYLVFSFLFMKMFTKKELPKTIKKLYLLAVLVPLLDELHQIPIPGREFSVYDIFADFLGFLVIILIYRFRKKKTSDCSTC